MNKRLPFFILPLSLFLAGAIASRAANLYVSPSGDDQNPGTQDQPVRTLDHVRDLVRTMNQTMSDDITVYLAGGTYRLSKSFTLGALDSGMNGFSVIYTAR